VPLVAMAHRGAFVLSTSIADPEHLFAGVTAALRYPGPALIDVHTPIPPPVHWATPDAFRRCAKMS